MLRPPADVTRRRHEDRLLLPAQSDPCTARSNQRQSGPSTLV
jgi:hypothetical protein